MNNPKKPARWQLDVWTVLMLLVAVLLLRASIPESWKTIVQTAWCILMMGGMGVWVWCNRDALRHEDQEQRRKQRDNVPPLIGEHPSRTIPLTAVQRNFLDAMGRDLADAPHVQQPQPSHADPQFAPKSRPQPLLPSRNQAVQATRTGATPGRPAARRTILVALWFSSMIFTIAGACVFLVLLGASIAPFWSRVALVLDGAGGALALSTYRARPSWRLLAYPLLLAALIYLWDDTLPPPTIPAGYARLVLPLLAFGWMSLDGGVRLRRIVQRALRTDCAKQE